MSTLYELSFSINPKSRDAGMHFLLYLASKLAKESSPGFLSLVHSVMESGESVDVDDYCFNGSTSDGDKYFYCLNSMFQIGEDFSFCGWMNVRRGGALYFLNEVIAPFKALLDVDMVQTSVYEVSAVWSDGERTVWSTDEKIIDSEGDGMPTRAFEIINNAFSRALEDMDEEDVPDDLGYKVDNVRDFTDWAFDPPCEDIDTHGELIARLSENLGDQYRSIPAHEIFAAFDEDRREEELI